ncbi:hypothetical protein IKE98_01660 [Candidatus Saccharibacteria bacterium]|nr:hypothetical protein [Candidatus Saccharibacteria bacterium]
MRKSLKKWFLVAISFLLSLCPNFVHAQSYLDQSTMDFYSQNNILFYDPTGGCNPRAVMPVLGKNVTWIGDSYSEGAELDVSGNLISKAFPGVDIGDFDSSVQGNGTQSATSYLKRSKGVSYDAGEDNPGGIKILEKIVNDGELRPYLVFALGANNGITEDEIEKVLNLAGSDTKVVFANFYMTTDDAATQDYIKSSNDALEKALNEHSNMRVADWASIAKPEYYSSDPSGVHPFTGYKEWVNTISKALSSFSGGIGENSDETVGNNQNYAGETVWSEEQLAAINNNKPVYQKAEEQFGIPWQLIATVHRLEGGLTRSNPSNGQGVYQLYTYTAGGTNENAFLPEGPVDDEEFERQTLIVAEQLKAMADSSKSPLDSDDGIKEVLFRFNGKAPEYIDKALALGFTKAQAEVGEGSPYVMNRYDAKRDPNSDSVDPAWLGRYVTDGGYKDDASQYDFGGFVLYKALAGASSDGNVCFSQFVGGNFDLNETAAQIAWPEAEQWNSTSQISPGYAEAIKQTWTSGYELTVAQAGAFNRGDGTMIPVGKSCDNFVGTVVRASGIDPNFPVWLGDQKDYLASSDMWELVEVTDSSQAMPGDIRIENGGGHILMIVEVDGELKVASASSGERFGDISSYYYQPGLTYRLKV